LKHAQQQGCPLLLRERLDCLVDGCHQITLHVLILRSVLLSGEVVERLRREALRPAAPELGARRVDRDSIQPTSVMGIRVQARKRAIGP
jgi:hypothetical protein